DNVALSVITIKVTSPKVTDYTVSTNNVSGTSLSLSSYSFDTGNSTYAGMTGGYTVTLFAKDTSNNFTPQTWNFTVVAPTDTQAPQFTTPQLNGADPSSTSNFQATQGQVLGF